VRFLPGLAYLCGGWAIARLLTGAGPVKDVVGLGFGWVVLAWLDDLIVRCGGRAMGTAERDQVLAAEAEADAYLREGLAALGGVVEKLTPATMPAFLARWQVEHTRLFEAGKSRGCEHARVTQVFHTAVWYPGVIACGPCMRTGILNATGPDRWRCDSCGEHCEDGIAVSVARTGMMIVWFGLCDACYARYGEHDGAAG